MHSPLPLSTFLLYVLSLSYTFPSPLFLTVCCLILPLQTFCIYVIFTCFFPMHISGFSWRRQQRRWQQQRLRLQLCSVGKFNWKWSVHASLHCVRVCVCVLVCVCIECSAQDYFANNRNKLNLWNEFHYETASRCEIGNSNWSLSNNQHQIHNERTTDRER